MSHDEFEMKIGDSLRRKIDHGLANSRFGVVVISHSFIKKGWTNYELDGIMTKTISGQQVLLPIWHDITKQEVIDYSRDEFFQKAVLGDKMITAVYDDLYGFEVMEYNGDH